ncbi:SEC14-like protein 2 [Araneus ventricosus]|uniref:SEC14-like protein 2 n=1 Tax=Araneus ventricosus TaxID=182803 RepID=A0A4Y2GL09_ARAVE|nr:SEC14-like protein 2 [Araneus ventricosus]
MALTYLSPEEQAVIEELKRRTTDCVTSKMLEDNYLFYRFAKARDFNLAEAESMLRKHVCWRKEFQIDTILTDYKPPEVLVKYVPYCHLCFDKEGCTVLYVDCGRLDHRGLWNCAKKQDLLQYLSYSLEQEKDAVLKLNKKFGKHIFVAIFDFENLPYAAVTHMKSLQYCLYFSKAYIDNCPETLKCAFVINAPFYFLWGFAVLKQVLPATIVKKVQIYGTVGWREELLKLIDGDVLPAFMGGNKTDPDGNPHCKTFVKRAEPIPKSCYMTNERKKLSSDFVKLTILPFKKEEINFEVEEANSDLEWEYEIKSRDIDFSLHFKGETLETVELIPKQRTEACYETEKGLFKCEKAGTCKYNAVILSPLRVIV